MRVINSNFQIVKITFNGANLSQRKLQLEADALGIKDAELRRRIGATFKIFEGDVRFVTDGLRRELEEIKRRFKLKPIGDLGQLVLARDRAALERELTNFQKRVQEAQKKLQNVITKELDSGKERLRELLRTTLRQEKVDQEWLEWKLDAMINRMGFPAAGEVLSKLECDWNVFHVSEQMINKEEFVKRVQDFYGQPIAQLAKVELAIGARSAQSGQ